MNPNFVESTKAWREHVQWKPHELEAIRLNYEKMSDVEIQKELLPHRRMNAVRSKRQELGCHKKMQKHQIWTPEEVETLLKVWKDYDQRQISERFIPNKTPIQVNAKKQTMKLHKPPVWTNEERGLLLDHGANYSSDDLRRMFFKNKTNNQIAWMRKHLGVRRKR